MRVLARANVQVDGTLRTVNEIFESPMTHDVSILAGALLLTVAGEDGSFPDPPPQQRTRCCGG